MQPPLLFSGATLVDLKSSVFDSTYEALKTGLGHANLEFCRIAKVQEYAVWADVASSRIRASDCFFSGSGGAFIYCRDSTELVRCAFHDSSDIPRSTFISSWNSALHTVIRECVFGPVVGGIWAPVELVGVTGIIADNVFRDMQTTDAALLLHCACADTTFIQGNVFVNISQGLTTCLKLQCQSGFGNLAAVVENNTIDRCMGTDSMGKVMVFYAGAKVMGNRFRFLDPPIHSSILQNGERPGMEVHWNRFDLTGYAYQVWPVPATPVDGHFNWWGDSTGPYHPVQNPDGQGDRVSDGVSFVPWLLDTLAQAGPNRDTFRPTELVLAAYPNPFNSILHLTLVPSEVEIVKVDLFDVLGRKVDELWHGPLAFQKEIAFDASALASGIYFARVTDVISRKNQAMTKVVLLK